MLLQFSSVVLRPTLRRTKLDRSPVSQSQDKAACHRESVDSLVAFLLSHPCLGDNVMVSGCTLHDLLQIEAEQDLEQRAALANVRCHQREFWLCRQTEPLEP